MNLLSSGEMGSRHMRRFAVVQPLGDQVSSQLEFLIESLVLGSRGTLSLWSLAVACR